MPLIVNFPTIMGVALCIKNIGHPWSTTWDFEDRCLPISVNLMACFHC